MDLLANVGMGRDGFQQGKRKVFGMGRGESYAIYTRHISDGRDQSCEVPVAVSVRIDVLSQQCDLLESLIGDPASLLDDSYRRLPMLIRNAMLSQEAGL